jgi:predicted MFS family arabinose efflux permease
MIVTLMFSGFLILPYMNPYLVANVGLAESKLSYIYIVGGTLTFLTSRWIGHLADQHGKKNIFSLVMALSVLPVLMLTNLPHVSIFLILIVTTLLTVLISGRSVPALSMITSSIESEHRGSFMSFTSAVQQLSAGFASLLAGHILVQSKTGLLENYNWIGLLSVASSIICIFLARRLRLIA